MIGSSKLKDLFAAKAIDPARCAHLSIDVEDKYIHDRVMADELETNLGIARRIGKKVAPAFNALGIRSFWFWMNNDDDDAEADFCMVEPAEDDVVTRKTETSAFEGTGLREKLAEDAVDTLIVTGFYAPDCVTDTLLDGVGDYRCILLTDCTDMQGLTQAQAERLGRRGVMLATSGEVIKGLRNAKREFSQGQSPQGCERDTFRGFTAHLRAAIMG